MIPHLAGVQDMRARWAKHHKHIDHDHRLQYRAMGQEDILGKDKEGGDDMPGDINIHGDTIINAPAAPPTPQITQQPTSTTPSVTQPIKTGIRRWLLPAAACVALPMLGAGGAMLVNYFSTKAPAVTQALNNLGIKPGVSVSDKP